MPPWTLTVENLDGHVWTGSWTLANFIGIFHGISCTGWGLLPNTVVRLMGAHVWMMLALPHVVLYP